MKSPEEWTEALTAIFHGWDDYMPDYHPSPDIIAIVEAIRDEQRDACALAAFHALNSDELPVEQIEMENFCCKAIRSAGKEKSNDRP